MGVGWGLPGMGGRGEGTQRPPGTLPWFWSCGGEALGVSAAGSEDQEPGWGLCSQQARAPLQPLNGPQTSTSHLTLLSLVSCPV